MGTLEAPVPEGPTFDPPTVPTGPDRPPRRRRRWWIPLAIVGFFLVSAVIGASVIEVPYYGVAPGDASPVAPRIQIDDAQTFSSEGEILFVTVTEPKLTALGALQGWLDPDVDVVPEKNILGDQTPQENRQTNLRLMSYSKDFATYVALKRLGYDVKVSDGGVVIDSLCMSFNNDGSCAQQSAAAQVLKVRDVITNVDGRAVNLPSDIAVALTGRKAGDTVPVTVKRDGSAQPVTVQVTLSQASDGRPILGIIPNDSPPDTIKFQFPRVGQHRQWGGGWPVGRSRLHPRPARRADPGRPVRRPQGRGDRHDQPERCGRPDRRPPAEDRGRAAGGRHAVPRAEVRGAGRDRQGQGLQPAGRRCRHAR